MEAIKDTKQLHAILLDLAKEFHAICVRHSIPYYMLGGTMLGAVRHKGFIPWDDDMDFGVPREHFASLATLLEKELPAHAGVLTIDNSDALESDIIKIHDSRTLIHERLKENVKESYGVNIDIFPLDRTPFAPGSSQGKKIGLLLGIEGYRFQSMKSRPFSRKIVAAAIKTLLFPLRKKTLINYINRHLICSEGEYLANHYGAWGDKETVRAEVMGEALLYPFEDTEFYGVHDPDAYLSSLYGDYMQLPPEDKRHLHIDGMYLK